MILPPLVFPALTLKIRSIHHKILTFSLFSRREEFARSGGPAGRSAEEGGGARRHAWRL